MVYLLHKTLIRVKNYLFFFNCLIYRQLSSSWQQELLLKPLPVPVIQVTFIVAAIQRVLDLELNVIHPTFLIQLRKKQETHSCITNRMAPLSIFTFTESRNFISITYRTIFQREFKFQMSVFSAPILTLCTEICCYLASTHLKMIPVCAD